MVRNYVYQKNEGPSGKCPLIFFIVMSFGDAICVWELPAWFSFCFRRNFNLGIWKCDHETIILHYNSNFVSLSGTNSHCFFNIYLLKTLIFESSFRLTTNWEEDTELSHIPLSPHMNSLPCYGYRSPEQYICYQGWATPTHHNHPNSTAYLRVLT